MCTMIPQRNLFLKKAQPTLILNLANIVLSPFIKEKPFETFVGRNRAFSIRYSIIINLRYAHDVFVWLYFNGQSFAISQCLYSFNWSQANTWKPNTTYSLSPNHNLITYGHHTYKSLHFTKPQWLLWCWF